MESVICRVTLLAIVPSTGLIFGLMLVAGIIGGYAARWLHTPRVVGFLFGGVALRGVFTVLLRPHADESVRLAMQQATAPLDAVKDLALGILLFMVGGVFELAKLKSVGRRAVRIALIHAAVVIVLVFAGCALVLLALNGEMGLVPIMILAALLGVAAVETAPAATVYILQEYDAKGPITDTILTVTGLCTILCLVAFHVLFLSLAGAGAVEASPSLMANAWVAIPVTTLGSAALGVVLGALLSILHAKLPMAETLLVFFAVFIVLGAGEEWLLEHRGLTYNSLLVAITVGIVFANVAMDSQRLGTMLQTVGTPLFAGFFVMAGFSLHIEQLVQLGWLGLAYVICRYIGKVFGSKIALERSGGLLRGETRLGGALLCQASVVIGLADFVGRNWQSPLAAQFATVILGSVVVFELIGPLLLKRAVVRGGEVKAVTLLRRPGVPTEGTSIVRVTMQALTRFLGFGRAPGDPAAGQLQVKHIMRTNVQYLRASATFDDALHFIERSTYTHFPVVQDNGEFVGVIHFADVRDVIYDPSLSGLITAADLADPDSPCVPMDLPLDALLDVFTRENLGIVPVVEKPDARRIVGIVEQRDLFRAMHRPST